MRFVRVKLAPKQLQKVEHVIEAPSFVDEVMSCEKKRPRNHTMSINYLRELVAAVGSKYVGPTFNAFTDVNVSQFKGVPCESPEQAHEILLNLFKQCCPSIFDAFVEYHVQRRPTGTNLIYFYGAPSQVSAFIKLGFEEVLEKDLKPKKAVGKSAITDEEAAANRSQTVV